jgi:lia operon protein LiaG
VNNRSTNNRSKNNRLRNILWITTAVAIVSLGIASVLFFATDMSGLWNPQGGLPVDEQSTFSVEGIEEINIRTSSIDVFVEKGDGESVDIHLHGTVYSGRPESIPTLAAVQNGNILKITTERKDGRKFVFGFYSSDLTLQIRVPEQFHGDLAVHTSSGDVKIYDQLLDELDTETNSGDIQLRSIQAAKATLETSSGDQRVEDMQTQFSQMTSSSGDQWGKGLEGEVRAESSSGGITLKFASFDSDLEVRSSSGDVRLSLTETAEFDLEARASSGDVDCTFPLTLDAADSEMRDNQLIGRVGAGTHKVKVRTSSGDITIRP